jgi:hypothetical protein
MTEKKDGSRLTNDGTLKILGFEVEELLALFVGIR